MTGQSLTGQPLTGQPLTGQPLTGRLHLVTGATGLLGRQVVQKLLAQGESVRALVRPQSDTRELVRRELVRRGVELVPGELEDRESLDAALQGVRVVYHCAARLGDWGRWSDFERGIVQTTRPLVQACRHRAIERLVHISSVAAYGHPQSPGLWDETQPLGQNLWLWDYYARAKMLAEQEAQELGERAVVIRPTWIYGPGDRTILPRIVMRLRRGGVKILGRGDNVLNLLHVSDVAEGVVLAGNHTASGGKTYNLCSEGELTQREFYALLCEQLQLPAVTRSVPVRLAHAFGFCCEALGRAIGQTQPPGVTRHGISLLMRPTRFSSAAARQELRWRPQVSVFAGLPQTLAWMREHGWA